MKKHSGGDAVSKGIYLNLRTGEFIAVGAESEPLPGTVDERYLGVPTLAVLAIGPIVGLAYIIFLPLAGLASLIMLAVHRVANGRLERADVHTEG